MAARLPDAFRQANEQLLSRGQKVSVRGGRVEYDESYFLTPGRASRLLESELESAIFGRILFPQDHERRDFAHKILHAPGLAKILLTILSGGTLSMVQTFERRFLRQNPSCIQSDHDLPFSEARAGEIFGEEGARFFEIQSRTDAITLVEGSFEQKYTAEHCLPYLGQDHRGQGSYGTVYMVRIQGGHYKKVEPLGTILVREVVSLARKDFEPDEPSFASFQTENDIFKSLHDTNPPSSIMRALCSITIKLDDHQSPLASIFSEPANGNLWQYFMTERKLGPNERFSNLKRMLDIAQGLKWLNRHDRKNSVTGNHEEATYVHGDLKPDNILIYPDPKAPEGVAFKIGDFGEARLMPTHAHQTRSKDKISVRRRTSQPLRVGTYWAPETRDGDIGTESDVWSFGCILLLVLLYNHPRGGGADGVRRFAASRAEAQGDGTEDIFYQIKRTKFSFRQFPSRHSLCSPAVTDCIGSMISYNKQSTNAYDKTATKILEYIQSDILVRQDHRADIRKVYEVLRNIMDEKVVEVDENQPVTVTKYPFANSISSPDSYFGHSPDGLVFCYSPERITFYQSNGQNFTHVSKGPTEKRLKWSDGVLPNSRACGVDAICIIHKTTPKDSTQLSIRYFGDTDKSTLVQLAEVTSVNGVSLSPDRKFLAVACESSRQGRSHARVRMYRVADFDVPNPLGNTATFSTIQTFVSTSSAPLITTQDDQIGNGEIRDVLARGHVDLVFSRDAKTLYHAHRKKHEAVVTLWDAEGADPTSPQTSLDQANLFVARSIVKDEDINYDHIFITSIVPLYGVRGFLTVTHEEYIIRRVWNADKQSWIETTFEAIRGLKTILVAKDNSRVVMLATPDKYSLELYKGTLTKDFQAQRLVTKNKINFDPREDSAYLMEDADGWLELQIATKQGDCIFTYRFKVDA